MIVFSPFKSQLRLCSLLRFHYFSTRFMMSSRCIHAARAIYHGLHAISNSDVVNNTTKNNHSLLAKSLVHYSMNDSQGIPQHKESLITHITPQKFKVEDVYEPVVDVLPIVKYEPHCSIDSRFIKELPVLKKYCNTFNDHVDWVLATNDSRPANFPHQQQSNQDFWVNLKTKPGDVIDKAIGLKYKVVPQDEKGGMGMFDSSTRGTLGMVYFDSNGQNIQCTSEPITPDYILSYNLKRIANIRKAMQIDNQDTTPFSDILNKNEVILKTINNLGIQNVTKLHDNLQQDLWNNIQCHPDYNRSISFVFIKHLSDRPCTPKENAFRQRFISLLPDKLYNLDKTQERRDITKAILIAYKQTIDPLIYIKLDQLKRGAEVQFSHEFIQILKGIAELNTL